MGALPQTPQETEFLDFQLDATARCGKTFQLGILYYRLTALIALP
jgi:hypothetical protein